MHVDAVEQGARDARTVALDLTCERALGIRVEGRRDGRRGTGFIAARMREAGRERRDRARVRTTVTVAFFEGLAEGLPARRAGTREARPRRGHRRERG